MTYIKTTELDNLPFTRVLQVHLPQFGKIPSSLPPARLQVILTSRCNSFAVAVACYTSPGQLERAFLAGMGYLSSPLPKTSTITICCSFTTLYLLSVPFPLTVPRVLGAPVVFRQFPSVGLYFVPLHDGNDVLDSRVLGSLVHYSRNELIVGLVS